MRHGPSFLAAVALIALSACSGGGSTSAPPAKPVIPGGAGAAAAIDQKITFVINVPAATALAATAARRRKPLAAAAPAATPVATTPYVSPVTGSVVLSLAEINALSPRQAPPVIPPINVPAACQSSAAGCTIPVINVPAALGTDRYFVQTYTGVNGTGNLISTGFVDVTVPVKSNTTPAIGGTAALSIGGFVANVVLTPASVYVVSGTPSDTNFLVQALDPGGAAIIGAAQYANAINVSVTDVQNFSIGGANSVSVTGPLAKPLVLHYGGGNSFGTTVQATTTDENGANVSATPIPVNVLAPGSTPPPVGGGSPPTSAPTSLPTGLRTPVPTPKPSPTQRPTQPLSLYVADGLNDTISEYRIASQISTGTIPNPAATPSRVIQFDSALAKSTAIGAAGLGCAPAPGSIAQGSQGTGGVTVDPASGTIFVFPNCSDGTNAFVFGFPANATGRTAPTVYDPFPWTGGTNLGLAYSNGSVFAGYSNGVYAFPVTSNGRPPTVATGTQCEAEFGSPSPGCFNTGYYQGFAVDGHGFAYVSSSWNDNPATGDAAVLNQPAAMLVLPATGTSATVTPYAAIAGLNSAIGGSGTPPLAAAVDGSTLYVLTGAAVLGPVPNPDPAATQAPTYFPGVSACPPPSSNAPINAIEGPSSQTHCADKQQHLYLAAYSIDAQLLGPSARNTDVDVIPNFVIGGDVVGNFGCYPSFGGQFLAAQGGFVYVINLAPTCTASDVTLSPEIDVYNTNNVSGAHTDIAPILKLPLRTGYPLAIAIGASGSVTGGQSVLREPRTRSFRITRPAPRRPAGMGPARPMIRRP